MRFLLAFFAFVNAATAGTVTLAWDRNPEPDVTGYVIYWGNESRFATTNVPPYPWHTNVANVCTQTVILPPGAFDTNWCFAATATNTFGLESEYSNEVCLGHRPGAPGSLRILFGEELGAAIQNAPDVIGPWNDCLLVVLPIEYAENFYRLKLMP